MPTEEQNELADAIKRYMPFAIVGLGFAAFMIQVITNDKMLSLRVFVPGFWLVFAVSNFSIFYTGRFKWRHGPLFTRESSPIMFYASALAFCIFTMSIATILVWGAYTSK